MKPFGEPMNSMLFKGMRAGTYWAIRRKANRQLEFSTSAKLEVQVYWKLWHRFLARLDGPFWDDITDRMK